MFCHGCGNRPTYPVTQDCVFLCCWLSHRPSHEGCSKAPTHSWYSEHGPGRSQLSTKALHGDSIISRFLTPQDVTSGQPACSTFLLGISDNDVIYPISVHSFPTWRESRWSLMLAMRIKCPNMKTAWHNACSIPDRSFCRLC